MSQSTQPKDWVGLQVACNHSSSYHARRVTLPQLQWFGWVWRRWRRRRSRCDGYFICNGDPRIHEKIGGEREEWHFWERRCDFWDFGAKLNQAKAEDSFTLATCLMHRQTSALRRESKHIFACFLLLLATGRDPEILSHFTGKWGDLIQSSYG